MHSNLAYIETSFNLGEKLKLIYELMKYGWRQCKHYVLADIRPFQQQTFQNGLFCKMLRSKTEKEARVKILKNRFIKKYGWFKKNSLPPHELNLKLGLPVH